MGSSSVSLWAFVRSWNPEISPWTLAFRDDTLEHDYRVESFSRHLLQTRISGMLGMFFLGVFTPIDLMFFDAPTSYYLVALRLGAGGIGFLTYHGLSFTKFFRHHDNLCRALLVFYIASCVMGMLIVGKKPDVHGYYVGVLISLLFGYAFMRMSFPYAMAAGASTTALYILGSFSVFRMPPITIGLSILFILGINITGGIIGYGVEYMGRGAYLLERRLAKEQARVTDLNRTLERRVDERTQELREANNSLLREMSRRERAQERERYLASALAAIRSVNRLLVHERNRDSLASAAVQAIAAAQSYAQARIMLRDGESVLSFASYPADQQPTKETIPLAQGGPPCLERVMQHEGLSHLRSGDAPCAECTRCGVDTRVDWLASRLASGGAIHGVVLAAVESRFAEDKDEHNLFLEMADDLGYGLSAIAAEEERRASREALRRSQQRLANTLAALDDAVLVVDGEMGVIVDANGAAETVLGYRPEELIGLSPTRLLARAAQGAADLLNGQTRHQEPAFVRRADGTTVSAVASVAPLTGETGASKGYVAVIRDVSEHERLEERLRQSQRLGALGQLAGGVAHDFNNLLTVINLHAELLLGLLSDNDPLRESAQEILAAGHRGSELTRQLLAFGRRQRMELRNVQPDDVLDPIEKLLRRLLPEDVLLRVTVAPDCGLVRVDSGQLGQVIMNLVVNARDAMTDGGSIEVAVAPTILRSPLHAVGDPVPPGQYVTFGVCDTGVGIPPDIIPRIFEPFFTTKEEGRGTGLGLATVYGIVRQFGGGITVESALGEGSAFTVYLPLAQTREPDGVEGAQGESDVPRGNETILLVEDEDIVRRLAKSILSGLGYTIIDTGDPEDAVAILADPAHEIDLVVSDVVMPGLSGQDLAHKARQARPDIPLLFVSGYPRDIVDARGVLTGDRLLAKPFTRSTLARSVREALDGA